MANIQEILQAVLGMQQNAQANLPVIPNNGNPNGAHNMPTDPAHPLPLPRSGAHGPAWLQPSAAMDTIHAMLANMGKPAMQIEAPPQAPPQMMHPQVQPIANPQVVMPMAGRHYRPIPFDKR